MEISPGELKFVLARLYSKKSQKGILPLKFDLGTWRTSPTPSSIAQSIRPLSRGGKGTTS